MTVTLTKAGGRGTGPSATRRGRARRGRGALVAALAALGLLALAPEAAADTLPLPLPISTSESLFDQFGYAPDHQRNVVVFDSANRPVIRSRTASQHDTLYAAFLEGGVWRQSSLSDALRAVYPDFAGYMGAGGFASDRVVIDEAGRLYTVLTIRLEEGDFRNVMLYSADRGASWGVVELPFGEEQPFMDNANRGNLACEMPTGQQELHGPPFVAAWREIGDWPGGYATQNELYVTKPYWKGDSVVVPEPTLVTSRFLGMIQSVGGTSFATTVGDKTYFTWTQVRSVLTLGTPTYVGVYDHASGTVTQRIRAAWGHPINDSHCTPALAIDSTGILHLIAGAHGRPFRYTRSARPLDISAWTPEVKVLDSGYWTTETDADGVGKQTYASLVCGADDTLHLVFRQTRRSRGGPFPYQSYHALSYQTRPPGGGWSKARVLAYASDSPEYTNYYQKLTLDRGGRLYLSFNVYRHVDTPLIYRELRRFRYRMVWWSDDGASWEFATTHTMSERAAPAD
jgi:hypothetical protein